METDNTIIKIINAILAKIEESEDGYYEFTSKDVSEISGLQKKYTSSPVLFGKNVAKAIAHLKDEGYKIEVIAKKPVSKYRISANISDKNKWRDFEKDVEDSKDSYTSDEFIADDTGVIRKRVNKKMNDTENRTFKAFNVNPKKARKLLIISDLHIPFELQGIGKLVCDLAPDFDGLVINGDFLDTYSMSTFSKENDIPLYEEVMRGMEYLTQWVELYDKVIFNKGNHEMRIENYVGKNDKLNRLSFMSNFDVLSYMVQKLQVSSVYKHYDDVEKQYSEMADMMEKIVYTHRTAMKIGDAVIAHPTTFSSVPSRTITYAVDTFSSRMHDVRAVIIGHTHHIAKIIRNGVLGIESGCLCGTLPYELKGSVRLNMPSTGFAMLVQYNNHTDMNATDCYTLEEHISRSSIVADVQM